MTSPGNWPRAKEYREAVQAPKVCFAEARLKKATIHTTPLGIPLVTAGKSAIVFKATAGTKDVAIRCFTRAASDQRQRYRALHAYLGPALPPYLVGFTYRDQEILVGNNRYPLVEMDWVEGKPLDAWVGNHLGQGTDLVDQAAAWLHIANDMLDRKLAHGDVANDNCLVSGSQLRFIDYDGCFIPGLATRNPGESGAQHFQHPSRPGYYAANMDAFPSLVVFLSMLALQGDPSLWGRFHTDRNLIFLDTDFKAPGGSDVWASLASSADDRVRLLTAALATMCQSPISTLPPLRQVTAQAGIEVTAEPPWTLVTKKNGAGPTQDGQLTLPPRRRDWSSRPAPARSAPPASVDPSVPVSPIAWIEDHLADAPDTRRPRVGGGHPMPSNPGPQRVTDNKPTVTPPGRPSTVSPATGRPAPARPTPSRPVRRKRHRVLPTLIVILLALIVVVFLIGLLTNS